MPRETFVKAISLLIWEKYILGVISKFELFLLIKMENGFKSQFASNNPICFV